MKLKHLLSIALVASVFSTNVLAGPECNEPQETWLPAADMQKKILEMGYSIDLFKVTKGNCYEIYGKKADGQKVEVYFNPASGEVLKEKTKG